MSTQALTKKDFQSDQIVRWCPGCGDYAILSAIQSTMPKLGIDKENIVFISGIGCSSRFPYYMDTYGFHTIHGRAPTIATGLKTVNPDLSVWLITGDGDGLSIGGNHLLHVLRRNMDINILLFNNQIYGLTKGQYSPTSEMGKKTKSSPMGSLESPINPIRFALAAEASFVARTYDTNTRHMAETFEKAAAHKGTSFVEIYQNCVIFNKDTFDDFYDRKVRDDHMIHLEEGEPLIFGKEEQKGVYLDGMTPVIKKLSEAGDAQPLAHKAEQISRNYAGMLAEMEHPAMPVPVGVFRKVNRPTYENMLHDQVAEATAKKGEGRLEDLFTQGDTWSVD
ncbi:MAG: 2-oxoacid:ferredoxin oxidoreductase subunit beta [Acidobacteriota bacterium]|nr:2-oxoacid:ferredoxin oxidoreductase subunit beta [Acidobacteriota bacterium]